MLADVLELLSQTFPSIDPTTARQVTANIRARGMEKGWLFRETADPDPWQADVLTGVELWTTDGQGELQKVELPVMLLSNTCDCENDDRALFAPCIPASEYDDNPEMIEALKKNQPFGLFYLPGVGDLPAFVVDLSFVHSVDTGFLRQKLTDGTVRRVARMSDLGYYVFLAKLTLHLLRPESEVVRASAEQTTQN